MIPLTFPASREGFVRDELESLMFLVNGSGTNKGPMMEIVLLPVEHTHPKVDIALTHIFGKKTINQLRDEEADVNPEAASGVEESDCG